MFTNLLHFLFGVPSSLPEPVWVECETPRSFHDSLSRERVRRAMQSARDRFPMHQRPRNSRRFKRK